jgi:hypothetical protein
LARNVTDWEDHGQVEPMLYPVDEFRVLVCDDLEMLCGLVYQDENEEDWRDTLPSDIAVACLLHPLVGGMSYLHWC